MERSGVIGDTEGELGLLCSGQMGHEIPLMGTTGPWGPCQRGSLGFVLPTVAQASMVFVSLQVSCVMRKFSKSLNLSPDNLLLAARTPPPIQLLQISQTKAAWPCCGGSRGGLHSEPSPCPLISLQMARPARPPAPGW